MKIVIDISEEDYRRVQDGRASVSMMKKAIRNGIPLDKIRAEILEKCFDVPYKNQAFDYGLKIVKWSDVRGILDKYKAESEVQDAKI